VRDGGLGLDTFSECHRVSSRPGGHRDLLDRRDYHDRCDELRRINTRRRRSNLCTTGRWSPHNRPLDIHLHSDLLLRLLRMDIIDPVWDDEQWATANSLYAEAACPTNTAREELYDAIDTNDIAQLAPVAASASSAFDAAANVFLDHSWPVDIAEDIQFLGETSAQLAESWGEVAESADMNSANAVSFPDAQSPFEAAQRIRAELSQHGQEPLGC
jgi:hypothetical protein